MSRTRSTRSSLRLLLASGAPLRALAQRCFTHRRLVLVGWLVALVGLSAIHAAAGSGYKDSFRLSGTDSADALRLLQRAAPKAAGDTDRIVLASRTARLTDPVVRSRVVSMLAKVAAQPHVATVASPYAAGAAGQIAPSGRIGYALVTFDKQAIGVTPATAKRVLQVAQSARSADLDVELGGQAAEQANKQSAGGTGLGFLAAAIVLFLVFGSVLSAVLPLITAGVSLGVGVAVIGLLSHALTMASFSSQLSLLIGLGVGIDYALFIVTRFRQGLLRGLTPEQAAVQAVDTAGRAVLFAGMTVCIALLGMFALGVSFLYGVAVAASIVVAVTVVASLTLLPALLGFFGTKVLSRRARRTLAEGRLTTDDESPGWGRWARRIQRRPGVFAAVAAALLILIAVPLLSMRLGSSDQGNDPTSTTTRKAYDLLAKGFGPGFNGPLQLVADVRSPAQSQALKRALTAASHTSGVVAVTPPRLLPSGAGKVAIANVVPRGSPQDASTTDLLHTLRNHVLPNATRGSGLHVFVGGQTAIFEDFSQVLTRKLPLFIGIVVLLSFLLLMAVFRSLVIPAMAAVMNLLSVGAAFGVVVAVFQWGWLSSLIGVDRTGPIEAFLPVMVFAILFGLSMDYEVFLVSRIYEEWHRRRDNREAVIHGLAATGRTITAAAAIMIVVFGAFVLGGERVIKLFGIGLAGAVFLDALVVRSIIVPGLMLAIGERNWALPGFLDRWLPQLNVEGSSDG
ncbi:MAG: family transporter [Solirubrobacteraceae bacterium]|nr:family transporter [Solirubrobacteraceae bacterium]